MNPLTSTTVHSSYSPGPYFNADSSETAFSTHSPSKVPSSNPLFTNSEIHLSSSPMPPHAEGPAVLKEQLVEKSFFSSIVSTVSGFFTSSYQWVTSWFTAPSTSTTTVDSIVPSSVGVKSHEIDSLQESLPINIENERPDLDKPEPLEHTDWSTLEKTKLKENIDYSTLSIEQLVNMMVLDSLNLCKERVEIKTRLLKNTLSLKEILEQLYQDELKKAQEMGKISQSCSMAEKIIPCLGLFAGAATSLTAGLSFFGIGALAFGSMAVLDHFMDDYTKKSIAAWIAPHDQESQSAWLSRLHLGTNLVQIALSFGLSGSAVVNLLTGVSQAATTGVKMVVGYQENGHKANVLKLETGNKIKDHEFDMGRLNVKKALQASHEVIKNHLHALQQHHKSIMRIARTR